MWVNDGKLCHTSVSGYVLVFFSNVTVKSVCCSKSPHTNTSINQNTCVFWNTQRHTINDHSLPTGNIWTWPYTTIGMWTPVAGPQNEGRDSSRRMELLIMDSQNYTLGKSTWNTIMEVWNMIFLFKGVTFRWTMFILQGFPTFSGTESEGVR